MTADRPFALPPRELRTAVLDLPAPPSVNRTRKVDWAAQGAVRKWKAAADNLVMASRQNIHKIPGQFEVRIVMSDAMVGLDLDNGVKSVIDYLRRIELVSDDSKAHMRKVTIEWGHAPEGCRAIVTELA